MKEIYMKRQTELPVSPLDSFSVRNRRFLLNAALEYDKQDNVFEVNCNECTFQ